MESGLRRNPHYAHCRDLQQLLYLRIFVISHGGYETFVRRQLSDGARLGDIKPAALSRASGWSRLFSGEYWDKSGNGPKLPEANTVQIPPALKSAIDEQTDHD